jgi:protein prenyltransferase alpha subunit repeat containing protein 1
VQATIAFVLPRIQYVFFYYGKLFSMINVYHFKQALWLHRRFLSMWWINSFPTVSSDGSYHSKEATSMYHDFGTFLQNELCLLHVSTSAADEYGDFQAQATYSASYILWLKLVCELYFH